MQIAARVQACALPRASPRCIIAWKRSLDRRVQPLAIAGHPCVRGELRDRDPAAARRVQLAQRLAGQSMHFERTLNSLRIVRLDARARHCGSSAASSRMQRRPAALRRFGIDCRTHCRVRRRHLRESAAQRTEIEHRAADQQRQLAARVDVVDRLPRVAHELSGRVRLRRIENVDQVMRIAARRTSRRRLAGADVHAAIDHRRIDADDLDAAAARPGAAPDRSCRRRSAP